MSVFLNTSYASSADLIARDILKREKRKKRRKRRRERRRFLIFWRSNKARQAARDETQAIDKNWKKKKKKDDKDELKEKEKKDDKDEQEKKEDDLKIDLNDKISKKKVISLMIVDMIKKENLWLCEKVKYVQN